MSETPHILLAISGPGALIFVILFIFIVALPFVFYLLTLQSVLREIGSENRKIQPEQVWLSVIPVFGLIWQYFIVARMAESLKLELEKRNIYAIESRPGYRIGIAFCILMSCSIIPYLGVIAAFAGFACWIIYWVKINDYRNTLIENPLHSLKQ